MQTLRQRTPGDYPKTKALILKMRQGSVVPFTMEVTSTEAQTVHLRLGGGGAGQVDVGIQVTGHR